MDGLPHLLEVAGPTPIGLLLGNPSLSSAQILGLKTTPYGDGLLALLGLKQRYNVPVTPRIASPGEVSISQYWNLYPYFDDTNNLSLVTFVHGPAYSVLFAGDLERKGWVNLLANPAFRRELGMVRIFVASHHGRESGYCEDVFDHCWPDVVVISDEPMQYDTQENCYGEHARGISWNGGREVRRVLTTRCDGHLRIGPRLGALYHISASAA
jgi:hypothetical protein